MRQTITIPGRLPGMNEYSSAQRGNRYKGAQMKADAQRLVEGCIIGGRIRPASAPVTLHYRFFEPNCRRDLDNIAGFAHKVTQDALVSCGILTDDGWKEIKGFTDVFAVDRNQPRIEVDIEEGGGANVEVAE